MDTIVRSPGAPTAVSSGPPKRRRLGWLAVPLALLVAIGGFVMSHIALDGSHPIGTGSGHYGAEAFEMPLRYVFVGGPDPNAGTLFTARWRRDGRIRLTLPIWNHGRFDLRVLGLGEMVVPDDAMSVRIVGTQALGAGLEEAIERFEPFSLRPEEGKQVIVGIRSRRNDDSSGGDHVRVDPRSLFGPMDEAPRLAADGDDAPHLWRGAMSGRKDRARGVAPTHVIQRSATT